MNRATGLLVAGVVVGWISTAQGASDEDRCLSGRAKAKGKYEQCVANWLGGGSFFLPLDRVKLSKCRERYAATWTRLQRLTGSPTCGGQPRYVDNGNGTVTD